MSVCLVNSKVTHVTGGNNQSTAQKHYYTLKIPRCTDTLVKARDFFFSVTHNDGTYSNQGHVHNKNTPFEKKKIKKERYNTRETERKYPLALDYILSCRMRVIIFFPSHYCPIYFSSILFNANSAHFLESEVETDRNMKCLHAVHFSRAHSPATAGKSQRRATTPRQQSWSSK